MNKTPIKTSIGAYTRNLTIYSQVSTCGYGVLVYAFSPTEHICVSIDDKDTNVVKSIAFIVRYMYNKSLERIKKIEI